MKHFVLKLWKISYQLCHYICKGWSTVHATRSTGMFAHVSHTRIPGCSSWRILSLESERRQLQPKRYSPHLWMTHTFAKKVPSLEQTYPTCAKGTASYEQPLRGICDRSLEGNITQVSRWRPWSVLEEFSVPFGTFDTHNLFFFQKMGSKVLLALEVLKWTNVLGWWTF